MTRRDHESEPRAGNNESSNGFGSGGLFRLKRREVIGAIGAAVAAPTVTSQVSAATSGGYGVVHYGAPIYGSPNGDVEKKSLSVETKPATDVTESSARLHGEFRELDGYEDATVYFEWSAMCGIESTEEQTMTAPDSFSAELTELRCDTEYEFLAVAEANSRRETGETLLFRTDGKEDENGGSVVDSPPENGLRSGLLVGGAVVGVTGAAVYARRFAKAAGLIETDD